MNKVSTKQCPSCGSDKLSLLRGDKKKVCISCGTEFQWELDKDQLPLLSSSRDTRHMRKEK